MKFLQINIRQAIKDEYVENWKILDLHSVHTSKDWLNVSVQFYKMRASMQSQSNSQQDF